MTGVILFRAQPFHNGHLNMVAKAYEDSRANNGDLYIFVGSADKYGTKRNPIPIEFRIELIMGSLRDVYTTEELKHIHIIPLDDLTDEADNSHNWGRYLYIKMFNHTKDNDMTIYYSDNPRIMLSWFDHDERWLLRFKFLDRYRNISATKVRQAILDGDGDLIWYYLPDYVKTHLKEIEKYLKESN